MKFKQLVNIFTSMKKQHKPSQREELAKLSKIASDPPPKKSEVLLSVIFENCGRSLSMDIVRLTIQTLSTQSPQSCVHVPVRATIMSSGNVTFQ